MKRENRLKTIHTIILYVSIVALLGVSVFNLNKVDRLQTKVNSINSYIVKDTINRNEMASLKLQLDSLKNVNDSLKNIKHDTKIITKTNTVTKLVKDESSVSKERYDELKNKYSDMSKYFITFKGKRILDLDAVKNKRGGIREFKIGDNVYNMSANAYVKFEAQGNSSYSLIITNVTGNGDYK